jgi:biotin carboxylase
MRECAAVSRLLLVCPTHRDRRELERIGAFDRHEVLVHDYASLELEDLTAERPPDETEIADVDGELERLLARARAGVIDGVASTDDYPGSAMAAIVARELGLPGLRPEVNLLCQHKYRARLAQRAHVPEAVPEFVLLGEGERPAAFPVFVKPVKSFFSVGARRVDSAADWAEAVRGLPPASFFAPFERLAAKWAGLPADGRHVLIETPLIGSQTTVEGYAWNGEVHVQGVVDSIFYPGTMAFERFEYPSSLPETVQERMADVVSRLLRGIGYAHGQFNVEMIHDPVADRVFVVEVNPRMSSQFADLFEKVDGTNGYEVLLDLAFGREPRPRRRQGRYAMAASCVLRRFSDARVARLPSAAEIEALGRDHPDVRVESLATEGLRLSQQMQDGHSYRYALLDIGGSDRRDVLAILAECLRGLTFDFAPV